MPPKSASPKATKGSPKGSPTTATTSPASGKKKDSGEWSQVADVLAKKRENLTLVYAPLRTIYLSVFVMIRYLLRLIIQFFKHPVTIFVLIPAVAAFAFTSVYYVPAQTTSIFQSFDVNSDGRLTTEEFRSYYSRNFNVAIDPQQLQASWGGSPTVDLDQFASWWTASDRTDTAASLRGQHRFQYHIVREIEFFLADVIWWVGLGVLSSVGLGTGMHSGLLFLFPHIFLTCAAADACGHTDFWTYPTNIFYGPSSRTFECISTPDQSAIVSTLARLLKVVPWCVLWGAGTAMGEIPPYALSYAAAKKGKKTDELDEVSSWDILNRMKNWTLNKIENYGFWAILLLAAWPNAAFDMCGMACGQFMMPFWTFFGATFIGKALIKVNGQALFFVALFSGSTMHDLVAVAGKFLTTYLPPEIPVDKGVAAALKVIDDTKGKIQAHAMGTAEEQGSAEAGWAQWVMGWVVLVAVGWFAKSIFDSFAQERQEEIDEDNLAALKKRAPNATKKEILKRLGISEDSSSTADLLDSLISVATLVCFAFGYKKTMGAEDADAMTQQDILIFKSGIVAAHHFIFWVPVGFGLRLTAGSSVTAVLRLITLGGAIFFFVFQEPKFLAQLLAEYRHFGGIPLPQQL